MNYRAGLFLLMLSLFMTGVAFGQEPVRVVILPFEVHAQEDLSYLESQIPDVIKTQLQAEGARVLVLDKETIESRQMRTDSTAALRQIGVDTGGDYVIAGSLTRLGTMFSLDAKLISARKEEEPDSFSAEGEGIENLPGAVDTMVQAMVLKLFKRQIIVDIQIKGNQRIEEDAIRRIIKVKKGDVINLKNLSDELKAVYAMGYFDDVRIDAETVPGGKILVFVVKEKPTVRGVLIEGNTWVYDDEEIKEELTIRKGSILNINTLQLDMRRIEEMYKEKNYYNVKVKFNIYPRKENQADVEYEIDEGKKFHVEKIRFVGNHAYSESKLKKQMDTSEEGILSFITSSGDLNEENLSQDIARLTSFYHNNGYVQARIGEPEIKFEEEGIVITIRVDEGPQFKVGEVTLAGDLIIPAQQLMEKLKIMEEEYYNRDVLRLDVITLTDIYSDAGYANVDITPRIDEDKEKLVVNITLDISKGKQVYFEEITITGNTKTRDKVIRRQLQVYEQELYSGQRLKRSVRNLYRLDYFEDVKVDTAKGSADDKMKLNIHVTEKDTGAFSFGAGYGNVESIFLTGSISERNLFGRGQTLALKAQVGAKTNRYTLSFTEPWLFDIPLSSTVSVYNWRYSFATYDKDSIGGSLRFSYPIFDYTRISLGYNYDIADINNVDEDAASSIKKDEGENIKSSITTVLRYDSRNHNFHPTRGSSHAVTYEFAGLGGTVGFNKVVAETGWYFPLVWQLIGVVHAKGGWVKELQGMSLPDYEKFYMVGSDSLRGFERDDLSPRDQDGSEVGGTRFVLANLEIRFPLVPQAGVYGVGFFDTGNIWGSNEDVKLDDLRESAGCGIRWLSPMGPVKLEYGWILDPKPTDSASGNWEFSMASAF